MLPKIIPGPDIDLVAFDLRTATWDELFRLWDAEEAFERAQTAREAELDLAETATAA